MSVARASRAQDGRVSSRVARAARSRKSVPTCRSPAPSGTGDRRRTGDGVAGKDPPHRNLEPELPGGTEHPECGHGQARDRGKILLYNGSFGLVQLLVDVSGYLRGGTPSLAGAVVAVSPTRIADSRTPFKLAGTLTGWSTAPLQITGQGQGQVPATGVAAVVLNVTAVAPTTAGVLTVWPSGIPRTDTPNLNFQAGPTIACTVVVTVGSIDTVDAAGKINIFDGSGGAVQIVVDVTGYILFGGAEPSWPSALSSEPGEGRPSDGQLA